MKWSVKKKTDAIGHVLTLFFLLTHDLRPYREDKRILKILTCTICHGVAKNRTSYILYIRLFSAFHEVER